MKCVFFALIAVEIVTCSYGSTTQSEISSSSSITQFEIANSSSTTESENSSSQGTVEQQLNDSILHSILSQQTTSTKDEEEEMFTDVIGESENHDSDDNSDADQLKTTLRLFNTHSVLQSVTLERNGSLVLEEGYTNATYAERFAYLMPGGDVTLSCNIVRLQFLVHPTKIVYKWIDRNGLDMEKYPRDGGRVKVTSLFQLQIKNANPEDSDDYFCIVSMKYPDHITNFTNELHFKVYVDPDIGLELPFIFEASSCNLYKNQAKMEEIQKSLCREVPCLYELQMECSTTPWFLKGISSYVSKTILQVTAIKFPHPLYRPPQCKRDCVMANKFDHIQTNMRSLQKTINEMVNTETLIFLGQETMKRRKVIYVCAAGYELHRENCVPCLAGQYSPVRGSKVCLNCPFDSYQDHPAQNVCISCASDYGTLRDGAYSASACYRKIHLIRYTVPFFIVCGIALGLLLICCALLMANYNHKFVMWIRSYTGKKIPDRQKKKKLKSSKKDPLNVDKLYEFFTYAQAAQVPNTGQGQTKEEFAQINQGIAIRGQEAFPLTPQTGKQILPPATVIDATGPKVGSHVTATPLVVPPNAPVLPTASVAQDVAKSSTAPVPTGSNMPPNTPVPPIVATFPNTPVTPGVRIPPYTSAPPHVSMPVSYPIPPGVIVPSNVALSLNIPVTQSSSAPPGFSVPVGKAPMTDIPNAFIPAQEQPHFSKTLSVAKTKTQVQSSYAHIPSTVNRPAQIQPRLQQSASMPAQEQPSFSKAPLSTNMQTQIKDPGSDKTAASTKMSIQQLPSLHKTEKISPPDEAVLKQSLKGSRNVSSKLKIQPTSNRKMENQSSNNFVFSNQQHRKSERAAYFATQNQLLLKFPETHHMLESKVSNSSHRSRDSFHSRNMQDRVESHGRNVKHRHAHLSDNTKKVRDSGAMKPSQHEPKLQSTTADYT